MKRKLIYFIALLLLMLINGIYFGVWFSIIRSLGSLTADEFITIGKVIIANIDLTIKIVMPLCIFIILLCLWFYRFKRSYGFYLGLTALILLILTMLITLFIVQPVEHDINKWSISSLPSNWESIRSNWQLLHGLRTLISLLSYGCFSWFILAAMRKNKLVNY